MKLDTLTQLELPGSVVDGLPGDCQARLYLQVVTRPHESVEYKNADVDRLLEAGANELDADKRRAYYEEAMAKTMADRVYISLVQLQSVWAAKAGQYVLSPRFDEDTLAFFIKPKN